VPAASPLSSKAKAIGGHPSLRKACDKVLQDERKKHKWNHTMVVDVTYQLGLLIESGVPLRRALQLLCLFHLCFFLSSCNDIL